MERSKSGSSSPSFCSGTISLYHQPSPCWRTTGIRVAGVVRGRIASARGKLGSQANESTTAPRAAVLSEAKRGDKCCYQSVGRSHQLVVLLERRKAGL